MHGSSFQFSHMIRCSKFLITSANRLLIRYVLMFLIITADPGGSILSEKRDATLVLWSPLKFKIQIQIQIIYCFSGGGWLHAGGTWCHVASQSTGAFIIIPPASWLVTPLSFEVPVRRTRTRGGEIQSSFVEDTGPSFPFKNIRFDFQVTFTN